MEDGKKSQNQKSIDDKALCGNLEGSQERRNISDEDYFKTCIEEIEKMDAILKLKIAEEKRLKMSRIKAEEESRIILGQVITSKVPAAIKINFREFISLLNQGGPTDFDEKKLAKENISADEESVGKSEKSENRKHPSGTSFIQKNIQLAKCGRGILSLTDEEQLRVQDLLTGIENDSQENEGEEVSNMKNLYGLDDESKLILSQIDQRLEIIKKNKSLKECSRNSLFLTKTTEGEKGEENMEGHESESIKNDGKLRKKKKINRLKEINKLLSDITSVSCEEIKPLPREDIESLVNQGRESVSEPLILRSTKIDEASKLLTCKSSHELMAE